MNKETIKEYNVILVFFDKTGVYSHTSKCLKSMVYDRIEEWSRTADGMCQIIDMQQVKHQIRNLNDR